MQAEIVAVETSIDVGNVGWIFYDCLLKWSSIVLNITNYSILQVITFRKQQNVLRLICCCVRMMRRCSTTNSSTCNNLALMKGTLFLGRWVTLLRPKSFFFHIAYLRIRGHNIILVSVNYNCPLPQRVKYLELMDIAPHRLTSQLVLTCTVYILTIVI